MSLQKIRSIELYDACIQILAPEVDGGPFEDFGIFEKWKIYGSQIKFLLSEIGIQSDTDDFDSMEFVKEATELSYKGVSEIFAEIVSPNLLNIEIVFVDGWTQKTTYCGSFSVTWE